MLDRKAIKYWRDRRYYVSTIRPVYCIYAFVIFAILTDTSALFELISGKVLIDRSITLFSFVLNRF